MTERERSIVETLCAQLRAACERLPDDADSALAFTPESDLQETDP